MVSETLSDGTTAWTLRMDEPIPSIGSMHQQHADVGPIHIRKVTAVELGTTARGRECRVVRYDHTVRTSERYADEIRRRYPTATIQTQW